MTAFYLLMVNWLRVDAPVANQTALAILYLPIVIDVKKIICILLFAIPAPAIAIDEKRFFGIHSGGKQGFDHVEWSGIEVLKDNDIFALFLGVKICGNGLSVLNEVRTAVSCLFHSLCARR